MFTGQLCKHFSHIYNLGLFFGIFAVKFDKSTNTLHVVPEMQWKVKLNYNLTLVWSVASCFTLIKYYKQGNINGLNSGLAFSFFVTLTILIFSLIRWYTEDICVCFNGFYKFYRFIHRKSIQNINASCNIIFLFEL